MLPFLVLSISTLVLRAIGVAGVVALENWIACLRGGFAAMFFLTASGHWGKRRPDLVRMVPAVFPLPDLIVTITGWLEILGAVGLLLPATAPLAAACLALLLMALFPANVRAARGNLTIGGKKATGLPLRTLLQIVFLAGLIGIARSYRTSDYLRSAGLVKQRTGQPQLIESGGVACPRQSSNGSRQPPPKNSLFGSKNIRDNRPDGLGSA